MILWNCGYPAWASGLIYWLVTWLGRISCVLIYLTRVTSFFYHMHMVVKN